MIALVISGVVCVINLVTFIIGRKKDSTQTVTQELLKFDGIKESLLKANMKLDQVCTTTTETQAEIKAMNIRLIEMDKRITIVENDQQSIWHRIDELKDDVKTLQDH